SNHKVNRAEYQTEKDRKKWNLRQLGASDHNPSITPGQQTRNKATIVTYTTFLPLTFASAEPSRGVNKQQEEEGA
ncbi:MAG: hypothetical protein Q4A92_05035, partial [Corynebacterium sp.]|nr:hypothetical protein [Corynebacterium sp.]